MIVFDLILDYNELIKRSTRIREFDDKDYKSVRINLNFKFVNLNRVDYSLKQF